MFNFKLRLCVVIFLFILREIEPRISDKRLCANEECTKPISRARTMQKYVSGDHGLLSFESNAEVTVYSKSAGTNMDLWGVEINGVRGYAPKSFLRETAVLTSNLKFLVTTNIPDPQVPSSESVTEKTIKANKVPEFTVFEGTTVYSDPDGISPTSTVDNISPTSTIDNISPPDMEQNLTEINMLDTDGNINHKETEPLEIKIDGLGMEDIETEKLKGEEEINEGDKENDKKESLAENLFQTLVDWIGDDKGTSKEKEVIDDPEETDVEEEEEEGDSDDEDDYESDEDDEEYEDSVEEENEIKSSETFKEDSDTSVVVETQSNPNLNDKEVKTEEVHENIIKTRQLLSEKDNSDGLPMEKNVEIEETKEAAPIDKINDSQEQIEINLNIDSNENSNSNDEISVETVTESAFSDLDGFEVPVSYDYQDTVTPNPIEDGNNDIQPDTISDTMELVTENSVVTSNLSETNLESVVTIQDTATVAEDTEPSSDKQEESSDEEKNEIVQSEALQVLPETKEEIDTDDKISDITEEIMLTDIPDEINATLDLIENAENENTAADSVENPNQPPGNNLKEKEEAASEDAKQVEDLQQTDQPQDPLILEDPAFEASELPKESKIPETIVPEFQENRDDSPKLEIPILDLPEDKTEAEIPNVKASEEVQMEDQPDVSKFETPENISDMFGGIANWFGRSPNHQKEEILDKNEETITENNIDPDAHGEINENIKSVEDDQDIEAAPPQKENLDSIVKHDHDFLSMIGDTQNVPLSEESQPHLPTETMTERSVEEFTPDLVEEQISPEEPVQEVFDQMETEDVPVVEEIPIEDEIAQKQDDLGKMENHIFDVHDQLLSKNSVEYGSCPAGETDCSGDISVIQKQLEMEEIIETPFYSDFINLLTLLGVTGFSVALFLLGFITIDKNRKEGSLIAKINTLEKALLVASKENALLIDRVSEIQDEAIIENDRISSEEYDNLNKTYQETVSAKLVLEDQMQNLEKELENSTEVGLELNRMLSDILSSQNGSETLIANVEQLQRQLVEQQGTINTINDTLNLKDTENHELQLELEIKNKKVTHLQAELDKMAMNLFKVEEEKEQAQAKLEGEIVELNDQIEMSKNTFNSTKNKLLDDIGDFKRKFSELQRNLEVKTKEYNILKENFNQIKMIKNNTEALESLLNASSMKAELQQLERDNETLNDLLKQEQQTKFTLEKQIEIALQEARGYRAKYDEADKEKLEAKTKLEVLSNYFKEKEGQLQKELNKQESMWAETQGDATSSVERIKYMQGELQNCKSQNEMLKKEIVSQEVELKSQISVLEKKAHESWVAARHAERRLEDAKHEAAQLRNRLTLKERSFIEDKGQNRIQSPLEQNGDVAISPLHMPVDTPSSPLLYGTRDHLTTSPPLPNLPPFLPPPPGVPFMPHPMSGVPGFMPPPPPPPSMFPGDHRPPPLGRMSSPPPPLNSRYSPDSRYSPYDRNSPSPPYDDEYGSSPPPMPRGYSPYNRDDRRDYKRPPPPHRSNGRNKGAMSSGSGNSNESLEKINRHHSKV